ncbi:MAG: hypothetical protein ACRDK2_10130 [Solirubrobacteraceae bacterium]
MAAQTDQPRLRRVWFGGFHREDVEALQARLAQTEANLARMRAQNAELTLSVESARLALAESAGWSERLPAAVRELSRLAAGDFSGEDRDGQIASAVLEVAGEHLIASVEVSIGESTGELRHATTWNENGRPVRTVVQHGECAVDCTWQPAADAAQDTAWIVEALCEAVVCSLVSTISSRVQREVVTQLGDHRSLKRHEALRLRQGQPAATVTVTVDEHNSTTYTELYGREAWSAALARAAATLDRIARAHGGQAYQLSKHGFALLVDAADVDAVAAAAEEELADYDGVNFIVGGS